MPLAGGDSHALIMGEPYNGVNFIALSGNYVLGAIHRSLYAAPLEGGQLLQLSQNTDRIAGQLVVSVDGQVAYLARQANSASGTVTRLLVATLTPNGS